MRTFKLENLPKDVYDRVKSIAFYDDWEVEDTGNMGLVYLEEGYVFDFDMSSTAAFVNRKDLIDLVRCCVIRAN